MQEFIKFLMTCDYYKRKIGPEMSNTFFLVLTTLMSIDVYRRIHECGMV